ncbi:hypothetical protein CPB84DRAFT_1683980, partial [Gymnopilus junonius]
HSDVRFADGTVIFQAQTTQFRVHKSVLFRHSCHFSRMFSTSSYTRRKVISPPVILLLEAADDWRNVLLILYDGLKYVIRFLSFQVVQAMLLLERKYEFEHFRSLSTKALTADLPIELNLWEKKYLSTNVRE